MKDIPEETRSEINKYLAQDFETLYSTLDLIRSSKEGVHYLPGKEIERGSAIFQRLEPLLRKKVCQEWNYCAKRHDSELQETVTLVAAIADVISVLTIGFPPFLISSILVKKGLAKFCECK